MSPHSDDQRSFQTLSTSISSPSPCHRNCASNSTGVVDSVGAARSDRHHLLCATEPVSPPLHCVRVICDPCLFKSWCGVITIILSPGYPCSKGGYKVILYFQSIHWYVSHIAVQSSAKSAKNKKETLSKIIIQDFPLIDIADNKTVEK